MHTKNICDPSALLPGDGRQKQESQELISPQTWPRQQKTSRPCLKQGGMWGLTFEVVRLLSDLHMGAVVHVHLHSPTGMCTHTYTHTSNTHKHTIPSIIETLSLDWIKPEGRFDSKTFVTSKSFFPFESIFSSERCIINTSKGYYGMVWNNVSKTTLKIAKLHKLRDLSFNEHRVPAVGCELY